MKHGGYVLLCTYLCKVRFRTNEIYIYIEIGIERDRDREIGIERDRDREIGIERDRDREIGIERDRDRDRDRER